MRKILISFVVLVIVFVLSIALTRNNKETPQVRNGGVTEYFREEVYKKAVENMGGMMPIEGFDAGLLMGAYGGLVPADFSGVETLEGHYEIQGSEVVFERDASADMISSAERTVSDEGYATLLNNISRRLQSSVETNGEVDALLELLTTSKTLWLNLNQSATAFGVTVTPLQVVEDSRCPANVNCVWAGRVRVRTNLVSGMGTATQIFIPNEPITTEAETVTLTQVAPEPVAGVTIPASEYQFVFRVEKR